MVQRGTWEILRIKVFCRCRGGAVPSRLPYSPEGPGGHPPEDQNRGVFGRGLLSPRLPQSCSTVRGRVWVFSETKSGRGRHFVVPVSVFSLRLVEAAQRTSLFR